MKRTSQVIAAIVLLFGSGVAAVAAEKPKPPNLTLESNPVRWVGGKWVDFSPAIKSFQLERELETVGVKTPEEKKRLEQVAKDAARLARFQSWVAWGNFQRESGEWKIFKFGTQRTFAIKNLPTTNQKGQPDIKVVAFPLGKQRVEGVSMDTYDYGLLKDPTTTAQ